MRNQSLDQTSVLLNGFARLPEKSVIFNKYNGAMEITLLVSRLNGEILDVDSRDLNGLQIQYLKELLLGEEILSENGIRRIEELLIRNYQSSLRKPVYSGIRACRLKLEELKEDDVERETTLRE